jgi:preprotein translocase subunit SecD
MARNKVYMTIGFVLVLAALAGGLVFNLPYFPDRPFKWGLDLRGGAHLIYQAEFDDVPEHERSDKMDTLRDLIERRINIFGVAEPVVQKEAGERLIVEIAGVFDTAEAVAMIGETPLLEFKEALSEEDLPAGVDEEIAQFNSQAKTERVNTLKMRVQRKLVEI